MIKLFYWFVGLLVLLCVFSLFAKEKEVKTIVLNSTNFISLNSEVDGLSVDKLIAEINKRKPGETLYIYVNSPGGSILDGNRLIEVLRSTDVNVEVVVQEAASMAAVIVEIAKVRHITKTGFLMFHHAQTQVSGDIEQVKARVNFTYQLQSILYDLVSERLGISKAKLIKKIGFEWFLNSTEALKENAVDDIVKVKCDQSILGVSVKTTKLLSAPGLQSMQVDTNELLCPL